MATNRDYDTLKAAWKGWFEASGRPIKDEYEDFAALSNKASTMDGNKLCFIFFFNLCLLCVFLSYLNQICYRGRHWAKIARDAFCGKFQTIQSLTVRKLYCFIYPAVSFPHLHLRTG